MWRLGGEASEALAAALEAADDLGHPAVGPGHLLLGLAVTAPLAASLAGAGLDPEGLRRAIPAPAAGEGPLDPTLHVVLRVARAGAGQAPVGARDLLAALLRAGGEPLDRALSGAGVDRAGLAAVVAPALAPSGRELADDPEALAPAGFSPAGAAVLARARELAEGHGLLQPDHLLVALLYEAPGLLVAHVGALADPRLREDWLDERFAGQGRPGEPVPLAPGAADVLAQSLVEAAEAGAGEVGPGHLLLGLLDAAPEASSRVLFDAETLARSVRASIRAIP
jgi:hypothetical protein